MFLQILVYTSSLEVYNKSPASYHDCMKIYTKTGDFGETGLYGGERRSKADLRVVAYGDVDELQAVLGVARSQLSGRFPDIDTLLAHVQRDCFTLSAELARTTTKESRHDPVLSETVVAYLESEIDKADQELQPLTAFILQGGHVAAAHIFHARAVCRRAERAIVHLSQTETVSKTVITYVNRLSDLLFTLARLVNARIGYQEETWKP